MDPTTYYVVVEVLTSYVAILNTDPEVYRLIRGISKGFQRKLDKKFPITVARRQFLRPYKIDNFGEGFALPNGELNGPYVEINPHYYTEKGYYLEGERIMANFNIDNQSRYINHNCVFDNHSQLLRIYGNDATYEYSYPGPISNDITYFILVHKLPTSYYSVSVSEIPTSDGYYLEVCQYEEIMGSTGVLSTVGFLYRVSKFYAIMKNEAMIADLAAMGSIFGKAGLTEFQQKIATKYGWKYDIEDVYCAGEDSDSDSDDEDQDD